MKYKEYIANVKYDDEADIFHGEVINIRDMITFQGKSVEELKQAFIDSVEDYIEFCSERGEEPDKPKRAGQYVWLQNAYCAVNFWNMAKQVEKLDR